VVDSRSTDGTPDLVQKAAIQDPRLRLLNDPPLPDDWVGRPWALHHGYLASHSASEWILGIDADTQPDPALAATVAAAAEAAGYDLVSCSPRFVLKTPGEWWLQPALLMTLVYRFGPAGADEAPERVMANGQCFLIRRRLLEQLGGYVCAKTSFCDDVTLARVAAAQGAKVGFWDGANLIKVRMYEGMAETWREWGRSLDLKNASSPEQVLGDGLFLLMVQALPLPLLLGLGWLWVSGESSQTPVLAGLLGLNGLLVGMRLGLLGAIANSYDWSADVPTGGLGRGLFWLSPLADGAAVLRIGLSSLKTPKAWRGRVYGKG
jgi:dolichol-phosphate mannosyltransferase